MYRTINTGKNYFSSSIFDPGLHNCINKSFSTDNLGVIACKGLNVKKMNYYRKGKKGLELVDTYNFDKMPLSEMGQSFCKRIEFFGNYQDLLWR